MMDPGLMKRVFQNLIMNTIPAIPKGGGHVTIGSSIEGNVASIKVEDTGVGIPEEHLDKLFKPLFTPKAQGQGFGLSVCKRVIEAHGGVITVESEVGKGANFIVHLPIGQERPISLPNAARKSVGTAT